MGFVVAYASNNLLDWGVKDVPGTDVDIALSKVRKLIERYQPDLVYVQDVKDPECSLGQSARNIIVGVLDMVRAQGLYLETISKEEVRDGLGLRQGEGKHTVATAAQDRFRDMKLPIIRKRNGWGNEAYVMPCLIAASLFLARDRRERSQK